jgi:hypothetical protein
MILPLVLTWILYLIDITSSLVHVGFGVWCLCRNLALKARLPGKVHLAPREKIMKLVTSQTMMWTWLQEAQGPTREDGKLWGPEQKMLNLAGQGALSKPRRNWRQGPTCRRENTLEDSGSIVHEAGREVGWNGPRLPGRPSPFLGPVSSPLT